MMRVLLARLRFLPLRAFALGLLMLVVAFANPVRPAHAHEAKLGGDGLERLRESIQAVETGEVHKALKIVKKVDDPAAEKLIRWIWITNGKPRPSYATARKFLEKNSHFPWPYTLHARVETTMPESIDPAEALKWFAGHPPRTMTGKIKHINALIGAKKDKEAKRRIREIWTTDRLKGTQEAQFRKAFGKHLRESDHDARVDFLLWRERTKQAAKLLKSTSKAYRPVAQARLAVIGKKKDFVKKYEAVPEAKRSDPGLVYDRIRWNRRQGNLDKALALMAAAKPVTGINGDIWWEERTWLARRALNEKLYDLAYKMVEKHEMEDGKTFAEIEFMAGWIALRYLDKPDKALPHFMNLHDGVSYPVSRARAAYWLGRTRQAQKDPVQAKKWFEAAATLPDTYYGQLAAAELGRPAPTVDLDPLNHAAPNMDTSPDLDEVYRAAAYLAQLGDKKRLETFLGALLYKKSAVAWRSHTMMLARNAGLTDMALRWGKISQRMGRGHYKDSYPVITPLPVTSPERALIHAIIRQESLFDSDAKSHVGARGLMQLMPATAKSVAKTLNLKYKPADLTGDPQYNITLGAGYLDTVLEKFSGSYILAIASYNAGPHRVKRWLQENGDPRLHKIDAVDWVERIPFDETRNYVQRVVENLQIYRQILGQPSPGIGKELYLTER